MDFGLTQQDSSCDLITHWCKVRVSANFKPLVLILYTSHEAHPGLLRATEVNASKHSCVHFIPRGCGKCYISLSLLTLRNGRETSSSQVWFLHDIFTLVLDIKIYSYCVT